MAVTLRLTRAGGKKAPLYRIVAADRRSPRDGRVIETREVKLDKEGVVRLGCNIHPSMAAFVIVVSAPHYAVADASGLVRFKRLQPGRYKVKAWSERIARPYLGRIEVKPGENQTTIALEEGGPAANPDKFGDAR